MESVSSPFAYSSLPMAEEAKTTLKAPFHGSTLPPAPQQEDLRMHQSNCSPGVPLHSDGLRSSSHSHLLPGMTSSRGAGALGMPGTSDNIRGLILEKEKELHDINEYRIRTLDAMLREKEAVAHDWKQKFHKLKEDFQYNLKLIEDRDEELDQYDANFANLKTLLRERDAEINELNLQLGDAESSVKQEKVKLSEHEAFYQKKLKELRDELESSRWTFDDEQRKQREEIETFKRNVERQMREKEEDLDTQRREITITFDEVMRQREVEFKNRQEVLNQNSRDLELKLKSQQREMDQTKDRNAELKKHIVELQTNLQTSEKELKSLQWELEDTRQLKDAKIAELEDEKTDLQNVKQSLLDEYEAKMTELLQSLHSVEKAFVQQREHYEEEIRNALSGKSEEYKQTVNQFETRIENLTMKLRTADQALETLQTEFKQAKWNYEDQLLQRGREIEATRADLQDTLDQRDTHINELKNQLWAKEVDIKTLQDKMENITQNYDNLKEKVNEQRMGLLTASDREGELQRQFTQLTAKWESKLEEQQKESATRHDRMYRDLQQAKDRVLAEKNASDERVQELQHELQEARQELFSLRSQARVLETFGAIEFPAASVHGKGSNGSSSRPSPMFSEDMGAPSPIKGLDPHLFSSESPEHPKSRLARMEMENESLRNQNKKMQDVIGRMRAEMEASVEGDRSSPKTAMKNEAAMDVAKEEMKLQLKQQQDYCGLLQRRIKECEQALRGTVTQTHSNDLEQEELQTLRTQTNRLSGLVTSYREQLESALAKAESLECNVKSQQDVITNLQRIVREKGEQIQSLENRLIEAEGSNQMRTIQQKDATSILRDHEIAQLQSKLTESNNEVSRLMKERESLMETNNQLRANLQKLQSSMEGMGGESLQSTVEKAEREIAAKYEKKIEDIEVSLKEFKAHNKILKRELRRIIKGDETEGLKKGFTSSSHASGQSGDVVWERRPSDASSTMSSEAGFDYHSRRMLVDRHTPNDPRLFESMRPSSSPAPSHSLHEVKASFNANVGGTSSTTAAAKERFIKDVEDDTTTEPSEKPRKASRALSTGSTLNYPEENRLSSKRRESSSSKTLSSPNVSMPSSTSSKATDDPDLEEVMKKISIMKTRRSTSVMAAADLPSSSATTKTRRPSDARLKLQHMNDTLELAGKKAELNATEAINKRSSARLTESQRDAGAKIKLAIEGKKREELSSERAKVRNYNDFK